MISSILLDEEEITLVPPHVEADRSLNLFEAHSMTLVVGPNGAGKTRLMTHVGEAIARRDPRVIFSNRPLANVRALYLSLSHFGRPPLASRGLKLQALNRGHERVKVSIDQMRRVENYFGSRAPLVITLSAFASSGTRLLADAARRTSNILVEDRQLRESIWATKRSEIELETLRSVKTESVSLPERSTTTTNDILVALSGHEKQIQAIFADKLRQNVVMKEAPSLAVASDQTILRSVHAVNELHPKERLPQRLLELAYRTRHSQEPDDQRVRQLLLETLHRLQLLSDVVGDPQLSRGHYPLDEATRDAIDEELIRPIARLELGGASSGLAALAIQLGQLEGAIDKLRVGGRTNEQALLIMIDEGDVFLHVAWQQKYIAFINSFVAEIKHNFESVQVILSTHSPILMSDFPRDCIHRLHKIGGDDASNDYGLDDRRLVSFGAPLEAIIRHTGDAGSMGEFARRHLQRWAQQCADGEAVPDYYFDLIDDVVIRHMIMESRGTKQVVS